MDELTTLIIVTHDVWAALSACDTILLLGRQQGKQGARSSTPTTSWRGISRFKTL